MERLRRTMLFVPGGNEKMLGKGLDLDVDSVIIDLEDSVAIEKKAFAREAVAEALIALDFGGKEKVVRINSFFTEYGRPDIEVVVRGKPDTLLLPKVSRPEDVINYDKILTEIEKREDLIANTIGLMALIETPLGVINIDAIALASPRMNGLLFGAADYTRETRGKMTKDRPELYYPMIRLLLAARVAGITAIDTPYFDIKDSEGLERHAQQARDMGYDGKAVIHPSQVEVVNRLFTPTEADILYARRVVEAFEKAKAEGKGAIQLDGQLIENVHVAMAQHTLEIAERAGLKR